ncbi:fructokinase-like 1 protein, chloroplastic [Tanacetum coccineum]
MAVLQILNPTPCFHSFPRFNILKASSINSTSPLKPSRRTRKKPTSKPPKSEIPTISKQDLDDFDDGIDFPYEDPPLVCCFGAAQKEFVPTVRVSDQQMHPDMYSEWKMLQWDPPEFARAPGGPPSNVAIAHVRLGGRAAFMGKVGSDDFGQELLLMMNNENVQTRGVKIDQNAKTGCAYMKIVFDKKGNMKAEKLKEAAEDSFVTSELNLSVLKEPTYSLDFALPLQFIDLTFCDNRHNRLGIPEWFVWLDIRVTSEEMN